MVLPENTKQAILEDEEDYYDEEEAEQKDAAEEVKVEKKSEETEVVSEILNFLINVLFEGIEDKNLGNRGIMDNTVIQNNINKIHKQVFVKRRRVNSKGESCKFAKQQIFTSKSFQSIIKSRQTQIDPLKMKPLVEEQQL